MDRNPEHRDRDEQLLIDVLLGRCDQQQAQEVADRIGREPAFRQRHDDLERTLAVLGKLPVPAVADDLTARTMATIDAARRRQARAELRPARSAPPTFTLRELVGVAAAVILMIAVFVPFMQQAHQRELRNQCRGQVGQIGAALQGHAAANAGVLPQADPNRRRWLPSNGEPFTSNSASLFKLVKDQFAPALVFVCPAGSGRPMVFRIRPVMDDFPSADHISYSYQHSLGGRRISVNDPSLAAVSDNMAILSDQTPVFVGGRFRPERVDSSSPNHGRRGQNVLYLSGHVAWRQTPWAGVDGNNIFLAEGVDNYRGDETPSGQTDSFVLPAHSRPDGE